MLDLLGFLCVDRRQPPKRQGAYKNHTDRGQYASSFLKIHKQLFSRIRPPPVNCERHTLEWNPSQRIACADLDAATIFAAREMGTAKFEPVKSDRMAKFTPITFPLESNTGPPEPP